MRLQLANNNSNDTNALELMKAFLNCYLYLIGQMIITDVRDLNPRRSMMDPGARNSNESMPNRLSLRVSLIMARLSSLYENNFGCSR